MDQIHLKVVIAVSKLVSVDGVNSIAYHKRLLDMGLDSSDTTELASILQTMFNVKLPLTLVFNFAIIIDLSS